MILIAARDKHNEPQHGAIKLKGLTSIMLKSPCKGRQMQNVLKKIKQKKAPSGAAFLMRSRRAGP